jgi:hypothetical protein
VQWLLAVRGASNPADVGDIDGECERPFGVSLDHVARHLRRADAESHNSALFGGRRFEGLKRRKSPAKYLAGGTDLSVPEFASECGVDVLSIHSPYVD